MTEQYPFDFETLTLSNGLTVWLSEDSSESKVYGSVVVRAGAKHTPNTGIAHYFEHIMFKGTDTIGTIDYDSEAPILRRISEKYTALKMATTPEEHQKIEQEINRLNKEAAQYAIPNDFNNLINKYGGSGLNAGTSYDYTLFYNSFTPQYLEHWCWLNSERILRPVFRLFQGELETVIEEKNMYGDNFATEPTQRVMQRVMAPHPYQYPIIGSTEHLKNPDLQEMERFWNQMYIAGNMALVLVGDFKREGLESLLEQTFGRIRSGEISTSQPHPSPTPFQGHEYMEIKLPIPMIKASGRLWHTTPIDHPDQVALQVIQQLLSNESKTGRLDQLTLNNLVIEATAMNFALNDVGVFGYLLITKPWKSHRLAKARVMKEIRNIVNGNISNEELTRTKRSIQRSMILDWENLDKRQKLLSRLYAQGKTLDELTIEWQTLERLAIEDIVHVAKKYIGSNFLEVRKRKRMYPKIKLSKPPFEPITAPNSHAKSAFAQQLEQLEVRSLELRTMDFERDVELRALNTQGTAQLYRTFNPSNDLFTLDLIFFRSRYHHPLIEQLSQYLELVGCEKYTNHQLYAKLQSIGATMNFETKESFLLISLTGFDRYFSETMEILRDFLSHPLEEPSKITKLKEYQQLSEKALRKDPSALSTRLLEYISFGKEAYFQKQLSLSQFKQTKPKDFLHELQQSLCTEMDAHYTGRLPIDEVAHQLGRAIPIEEITQPWEGYLHQVVAEGMNTQIHFLHDSSASQAIIRAYQPIGIIPSKELLGSFRLYNQYCGSGMGSLLFQEMREFRSLAYGVSSSFCNPPYALTSESRSHFTYYIATQADKLIESLTLMDQLIHQAPDDPTRYLQAVDALKSSIHNYTPPLRMRSRTIAAQKRQGMTKDLSLILLDELKQTSAEKLIEMHQQFIAPQPLTFTIVADKTKIDTQALSAIAPIREYSLKDLKL